MAGYHIRLEGDHKTWIPGCPSAAVAIQKALVMFPGRKVIGCYTGVKPEDVAHIQAVNTSKPIVGWVDFDVPPHEPYVEPEKVKKVDNQVGMFDEERIKLESSKALYKRDLDKPKPKVEDDDD